MHSVKYEWLHLEFISGVIWAPSWPLVSRFLLGFEQLKFSNKWPQLWGKCCNVR